MASSKRNCQSFPAAFIVEPKQEHKQTIISLHGLGSNGLEFGQSLVQLHLYESEDCMPDIFPHAKFIFPSAKLRRSIAFNRSMISQWFDIAKLSDFEFKKQTQVEGLVESAAFLYEMLTLEAAAVGSQNIVFGGISHGCAMSASLLLALDFHLGAYVGICGWLPFRQDLQDVIDEKVEPADNFFELDAGGPKAIQAVTFERDLLGLSDSLKDPEGTSVATPVFVGHGQNDDKVLPQLGSDLVDTLEALGYELSWNQYPDLAHGFNEKELHDIAAFIKAKCVC